MELHMTDFSFSLPTDVLRAALVCVSTEETRYYLRGVNVQPDGGDLVLASTDGHRLFCGRCPLDNATTPVAPIAPAAPFILPAESIKKALTGYKGATIHVERAGDVWTLGDVTFKPVDGTFPDYRRVAPTQKTLGEDLGKIAQFKPAYLADMGKIQKALGVGECPVIHHMGHGPAIVTFLGRDNLFCLLMPVRADLLSPADLSFLRDRVMPSDAQQLAASA
jgi:DNA polymerase III sliding clamp (beta) subunit (PCNA family)